MQDLHPTSPTCLIYGNNHQRPAESIAFHPVSTRAIHPNSCHMDGQIIDSYIYHNPHRLQHCSPDASTHPMQSPQTYQPRAHRRQSKRRPAAPTVVHSFGNHFCVHRANRCTNLVLRFQRVFGERACSSVRGSSVGVSLGGSVAER